MISAICKDVDDITIRVETCREEDVGSTVVELWKTPRIWSILLVKVPSRTEVLDESGETVSVPQQPVKRFLYRDLNG